MSPEDYLINNPDEQLVPKNSRPHIVDSPISQAQLVPTIPQPKPTLMAASPEILASIAHIIN